MLNDKTYLIKWRIRINQLTTTCVWSNSTLLSKLNSVASTNYLNNLFRKNSAKMSLFDQGLTSTYYQRALLSHQLNMHLNWEMQSDFPRLSPTRFPKIIQKFQIFSIKMSYKRQGEQPSFSRNEYRLFLCNLLIICRLSNRKCCNGSEFNVYETQIRVRRIN